MATEYLVKVVGLISTSSTGLQEVTCLLAREGVGVSQAISVGQDDLSQQAGGAEMLAALRALQADPGTEVIALVSKAPSPIAAERVLAQVRGSDKPTVVCFLGGERRLAWQAGAIPAARLDEAAMRAAAWVRGWDQALVSSRLEDQGEQLAALANNVWTLVGPERRRLLGLFTSSILSYEAQLMLTEVANKGPKGVVLDLGPGASAPGQMGHLRNALSNSEMAVILLDVVLGRGTHPNRLAGIAALAGTLREFRSSAAPPMGQEQDEPLLIAHVCGADNDAERVANLEARLCDAGVILAPSNAAAAQLAGMVVKNLGRKQLWGDPQLSRAGHVQYVVGDQQRP